MESLVIDRRTTLPASDLEWTAVRSSGPGGQNVNKVASKVDLRFDLEGTAALGEEVKARLRVLARRRLDADGRIVIVRGRHRDQARNLEAAREALRVLVLQALVPPKRRRPTRPSRAAKARRLGEKRRRAETKKARGPVRGAD